MEIFDSDKPTLKKPTLSSLLTSLSLADEELLKFTPDEAEMLGEDLAEKIDSCYYVLEKYDSEIARLSEKLGKLKRTKETLANNQKSLEAYIIYQMKLKGFEKLPGNEVTAKLIKRKTISYTLSEPDASTQRKYPGFVSCSYSWKKNEISEAIKRAPDLYSELGHVSEGYYLSFDVRRDI